MTTELLAPAGNLSALKIAINAGADAVYIGGEKFSARKSAKNFSLQEIEAAIDYAHKFKRKIYLAINTLIFNDEISEIIEYLYEVYKLGIDALIIQDFALYQLVKTALPNFELHASTQMAAMNLPAASFLEEIEFQRVVLARETSLLDMKKIKNESNIECEVFIHGALCISYSGLCYMSSLIGGRSGNRGDCAQPCRQKYSLTDELGNPILKIPLHLLSPKDLSLAELIPTILGLKIDSLKIEGRMKQDEYIYLVTNSYRELINNSSDKCYNDKSQSLMKKLEQLYSRNGFTKGFALENPYNKMMSYMIPKKNGIFLGTVLEDKTSSVKVHLANDIEHGDGIVCYDKQYNLVASGFIDKITTLKDENLSFGKKNTEVYLHLNKRISKNKITQIYLTFDKSLSKEIKELSQLKPIEKKEGIKFYLTAKLNHSIHLVGITETHKVSEVYSDYIVQPADKAETSISDIKDKLNRLGTSPFFLEDCVVDLDKNVFIPASTLNKLRQNLLLNFESSRKSIISKEQYLESVYNYLDSIPPSVNLNLLPSLVVKTSSVKDASLFLKSKIKKIILNLTFHKNTTENIDDIINLFKKCKNHNIELSYTVSPILNNSEIIKLEEQLLKLVKENAISSFYISNIGQIELCKKLSIDKIYGTENLNVTNDLSIDFFVKQGFEGMILSQELSTERLENISMLGNLSTEINIHSQSPAMFLQYNILKSIEKENAMSLDKYSSLQIVNSHDDYYKIVIDQHDKTTLVNQKIIHALESFNKLKKLGIDGFIIDLQYDSLNAEKAKAIIELYTNLLEDKISIQESKEALNKIYNKKIVNSYYLQ